MKAVLPNNIFIWPMDLREEKLMIEKQEWELMVEEAVQKLNLQWYTNEDQYSDGDVEEDIIRYIAQNNPEDYDKVVYDDLNWPIYYHLTNVRKNLLNWYPFKKEASVLEIGAGCGAITGLLCDRCRKVTAVELSKRRATAIQLRCREKSNLEVIVGNLNDIEFEEKFDYITLIGVLEYQGTYTDSCNPYKDFLMKVKSFLKEGGKLLIAIENKYGAKYWCGAAEDHTGIPFDGINQYKLSGRKVRTFAKAELTSLLTESGYPYLYYYYPMPDYKLPMVIYSEKYLPRNEYMECAKPYYIPSARTLLIDEIGIYRDIIKNNVFPFFSNSFFVECSLEDNEKKDEEKERVIFALLNSKRQKEYRIGTLIKDSGKVIKFGLDNHTDIHFMFAQMLNNAEKIRNQGLEILPYTVNENQEFEMEFVKLPTLEDLFRRAAYRNEIEKIWELWDRLLEQIEVSGESVEQKDCMIYELKLAEYQDEKSYGKILKAGYVDMLPKNCFIKEDNLLWFDQEWVLDNIPAKFILYRAMVETYGVIPELKNIIPTEECIKHYGMEECLDEFISLNQLFLQMIEDPYYVGNFIENNDEHIYRKNILKLL